MATVEIESTPEESGSSSVAAGRASAAGRDGVATDEAEGYLEMVSHNADALTEGMKEYEKRIRETETAKDELEGVKLQRNVLLGAIIFIAAVAVLEAIIIKRR